MTELPQITLFPATVLLPQMTEFPQITELPARTLFPQITELPQMTELPHTVVLPPGSADPNTALRSVCIVTEPSAFRMAAGDNAVPCTGSLLARAAGIFRYPEPMAKMS